MIIITLATFLIVFGTVLLIEILFGDDCIEDAIWFSLSSATCISLIILGICLLIKVIT